MMRALWTAASGMKSQQLYVDSIANNLANVNSIGFKKATLEFKSLFYETLRQSSVTQEGSGNPVSLQVGHGVRPAASTKDFEQGNLEMTENPLDFSIDGAGFFQVRNLNGEAIYTRNGAFKLSVADDVNQLVTSEGYPLLSTDGEPIELSGEITPDKLSVDSLGRLSQITDDGNIDLGIQIGIVQFRNAAGLDAIGGTYFETTGSSGGALLESENDTLKKSNVIQGSLESSNVQAVEEMVKMIIAQRAYELNSKSIQTSDDMLGMANNLKR